MVLIALAAAPTFPGTAGLYSMKWISKVYFSTGAIHPVGSFVLISQITIFPFV
jgi:hypothetical protein